MGDKVYDSATPWGDLIEQEARELMAQDLAHPARLMPS